MPWVGRIGLLGSVRPEVHKTSPPLYKNSECRRAPPVAALGTVAISCPRTCANRAWIVGCETPELFSRAAEPGVATASGRGGISVGSAGFARNSALSAAVSSWRGHTENSTGAASTIHGWTTNMGVPVLCIAGTVVPISADFRVAVEG